MGYIAGPARNLPRSFLQQVSSGRCGCCILQLYGSPLGNFPHRLRWPVPASQRIYGLPPGDRPTGSLLGANQCHVARRTSAGGGRTLTYASAPGRSTGSKPKHACRHCDETQPKYPRRAVQRVADCAPSFRVAITWRPALAYTHGRGTSWARDLDPGGSLFQQGAVAFSRQTDFVGCLLGRPSRLPA